MRTLCQELTRQLKRRDGLFPSHRREGTEKIVKAIAGLKVINEVLDWHASANEHGGAVHDLGIAVHNSIGGHEAGSYAGS
jgi:hypothetical protein